MSNVLRLAIVDPNDRSRDALKSTLLGMGSVWLEAECSRYEFFGDVVAQTHPDIGIVALDQDRRQGAAIGRPVARSRLRPAASSSSARRPTAR